MKQWLEKIRSFEWNDPMVIILVCLLVFLVTGTSIKGCLQMTAERKTVCIDIAYNSRIIWNIHMTITGNITNEGSFINCNLAGLDGISF